MDKKIEEEKRKLQKKKEKLLLKEKLIKEKEKQKRAKNFQEIGRMAYKANIDTIDPDSIFGAFIEISEKMKIQDNLNRWKENAKKFTSKKKTSRDTPLSISFNSIPPKEISNKLRSLNFKWNKFRKEFYGYGNKKELEESLKGHELTIEVLE